MRLFWVIPLVCFVLIACNAPKSHFSGASVMRAEVLGSSFLMRRRGDLVQVIRTNAEYAPRLSQQLGRRAEIAVERTYDCPVEKICGDAVQMLAYLKCGEPDDLARIGNGG